MPMASIRQKYRINAIISPFIISKSLSVFKKDDDKNRVYPLPIIVDGKIQKNTLYQIGKDSTWLHKVLREENYQLEDVFYGFYQKNKLFLIKKEALK